MTASPSDYDALAKRYLDLWQDEMAKLAQDPNASGAWANLFQGMMQNAAAAWGQASGPAAMAMTTGFKHGYPNTSPTTPDRAASTAASPGDGGLAVADVLRRIDARLGAIEQRLAALEAGATPRRRARAPKP